MTTLSKRNIKNAANDLLSLEINLIESSGITGNKMPTIKKAVHQIAEGYLIALDQSSENLGGIEDTFNKDTISELFRIISELADETISRQLIQEKGERDIRKQSVFFRISDSSKKLVELLENNIDDAPGFIDRILPKQKVENQEGVFSPSELIQIRKMWEMGTDSILMQTVVQIDGDVITRVHSGYTIEDHKILLDIHRDSVATSIKYWEKLVDTFITLFEKLFS